jgi:hypothetical protein
MNFFVNPRLHAFGGQVCVPVALWHKSPATKTLSH